MCKIIYWDDIESEQIDLLKQQNNKLLHKYNHVRILTSIDWPTEGTYAKKQAITKTTNIFFSWLSDNIFPKEKQQRNLKTMI